MTAPSPRPRQPRLGPRCVAAAWLAGLILSLLVGVPPRSASAGEVEQRLKSVRTELHGRLHELAKWCAARKLFGARHDVYDFILESWPDDEVARKWNGYERLPGGEWPKKGRKRPPNLQASGLPALKELQARIATWYVEAALEALAGGSDGLQAAWKGRLTADAVRIAPHDEALRAKNGEVRGKGKHKKKWFLVESGRSRERRPALRKAARKAVKAVPQPKDAEPRSQDLSSTVKWEHSLEGARSRILGLPNRKELVRTLIHAEAAFPVYAAAFARDEPSIPGLTLYSFTNTSRGNVFLADQPTVNQSWLKFVTPLAACWIPQTSRVMIKSQQPDARMEAGARQVFGAFTARHGVTGKQGWAVEGFGLYLTWNVTGTRLLYSVRQSKYGEKDEQVNLGKRLRAAGTDWFAEARTLVSGKYAPDLRLLLGKTVNTMTNEDVLYSYVFAVFLLEGHRDALPGLLRALGKAGVKDLDAAFGEHIGMDVKTAGDRLHRWLEETKDIKTKF